MKRIESLIVKYHQETVGILALSVDGKVCTFSTTSNGLLQVLAYLHKVYKNMICDFSSELSSFIIRYLFSLLLRLYILREWQHVVPLRILAELQQWYQQR